MARRYKTWNGAQVTTAAIPSVTTGTTIKIMLQLSTAANERIRLISWGFSTDDPPGADAVFELIDVDVAATTGTAHVAAGVFPVDGQEATASKLTLGTANTGYTMTVNGTPTTSRSLDVVGQSSVSAEAAPTMIYYAQFMPDERPIVAASRFLQVRATTPTTAVDMRTWICWEEGF